MRGRLFLCRFWDIIFISRGIIVEHGTISAYTNNKCRCVECRLSKKIYEAKRLLGRSRVMVPTHVTRKHLKFLMTNGWSGRALAEEAGVSRALVNKVINGKTRRIDLRNQKKLLAVNTYNAPYRTKQATGTKPKWNR